MGGLFSRKSEFNTKNCQSNTKKSDSNTPEEMGILIFGLDTTGINSILEIFKEGPVRGKTIIAYNKEKQIIDYNKPIVNKPVVNIQGLIFVVDITIKDKIFNNKDIRDELQNCVNDTSFDVPLLVFDNNQTELSIKVLPDELGLENLRGGKLRPRIILPFSSTDNKESLNSGFDWLIDNQQNKRNILNVDSDLVVEKTKEEMSYGGLCC